LNARTNAPGPVKAQSEGQSPAILSPLIPERVRCHLSRHGLLPLIRPRSLFPFQARLLVNRVGDVFEQEADRAAEEVLSGPGRQPNPGLVRTRVPTAAGVQRQAAPPPLLTPLPGRRRRAQEEDCCPDGAVQAEAQPAQQPETGPSLEGNLRSLQSGGQPLPPATRAFFENRFGYDFSAVRVHTGPAAAEAALAVHARAFTHCHDLVFGPGEWAPESEAGQRLLAHELAHVIQQNAGGQTPAIQRQALDRQETAEPGSSETTAAGVATPSEDTGAPVAGLIVEDDAPDVQPHQLRKTAFLNSLYQEVCQAADDALASTGRSSEGCPYLNYWFDYYGRRESIQIERAARHFEPATASARSAADLIPPLVQRVRTAIQHWVLTGEITSVPEGVPTGLPDAGGNPGNGAGSGEETAAPASASESSGAGEAVLRKARRPSESLPAGAPGGGAEGDLRRSPAASLARMGPGQLLGGSVQTRMESAFGASFSHVHLHTGPDAAALADQLDSRAFTIGSHIIFASGEYRPGSLVGDALLAHELAHVIQQGGQAALAPAQSPNSAQSTSGSLEPGAEIALESDADTAALGAVIAIWTGARGALKMLARNAKPSLKSGLRLQSCKDRPTSSAAGSGSGSSTTATPPPPSPPPTPIASDFQVLGLEADPIRTKLFFERGSAALASSELDKFPGLITHLGTATNLTLDGYRSEDEPASLADNRNTAVDTELSTARTTPPAQAHPQQTGAHTKVNKASAGIGEINYRQVRMVEVKKTGTASSRPPSCTTAVVICPPAPNHFTRARVRALSMLQKAITELNKSTLTPAVASLLNQLFSGGTGTAPSGTAAFVAGKLNDIKTLVTHMPAHHECHNLCDSDCNNTEALHTLPGVPPMLTLCPNFFTHNDTDNAVTLIHEGSHGTPGLATKDKAYAHERGIRILSAADERINADSYALLVRLTNFPSSASIGFSGDVYTGMNPTTEEPVARRALAFLEKWLIFAYQDVSGVYATANEAHRTGAWPTVSGAAFDRLLMGSLSFDFPLTDPGSGPSFHVPTADDVFKLAAIFDRYLTMREVMHSSPVTLEKKTTGADEWEAGPGAKVKLTNAFFSEPDETKRVKRLLELLLIATPNVSPAVRIMYINAANHIRLVHSAGP
jgi:hypothetical protein